MKIVIIDYGAGNVFSVRMALKRLGYEATVSDDAAVIERAARVIFPGVGQAAAAMEQLRKKGLDRVMSGLEMPVLGICLGMQLMCESTEEESTEGLGIFPVQVKKIEGVQKVPHMGWNSINGLKASVFDCIEEGEKMYFVHSFYVPVNEYTVAECDYHRPFTAVMKKDNFLGCQFHPEKSAGSGACFLRNFLTQ